MTELASKAGIADVEACSFGSKCRYRHGPPKSFVASEVLAVAQKKYVSVWAPAQMTEFAKWVSIQCKKG